MMHRFVAVCTSDCFLHYFQYSLFSVSLWVLTFKGGFLKSQTLQIWHMAAGYNQTHPADTSKSRKPAPKTALKPQALYVTSHRRFSKHHYLQITRSSTEEHKTHFNISHWSEAKRMKTASEVWAPRVHLVLSPIKVRLSANGEAYPCHTLSTSPKSLTSVLLIPQLLCFKPLMNNQCRLRYCTYEINLLPAVRRVMLLQENQCPSCCSLGLDRVYAHLLS